MFTERIKALTAEVLPDLIAARRHLHQHPELGYQEVETAKYLAQYLQKIGCQVQTEVAQTGVVGLIEGKEDGKVVALRSDMDALPVVETTGLDFASVNDGVMHACGHDTHMAIILGAATVLSKLKDDFSGSVKFIFQPAEEGPGGAEPMIEQGVLQNPQVDYILGGHVWPTLPVGKVGIKAGPAMSAVNSWQLTLNGKSGHGAEPHTGTDCIALAAQIINAMQQIVSRTNNPQDPMVLGVGTIHGGTRDNIIANHVVMSGTMRTFSVKNRQRVMELFPKLIAGICEPYGVSFDLAFKTGYEATINDAKLTKAVYASAEKILGAEAIEDDFPPAMVSEDFSFFAMEVSGVFLRYGSAGDESTSYALHHSSFNIDERVIAISIMALVQASLDLLA